MTATTILVCTPTCGWWYREESDCKVGPITGDVRMHRMAQHPGPDPTIGRWSTTLQSDISTLVQKEIQSPSPSRRSAPGRRARVWGCSAGAAFLLVLAIIMLSVAFAYFIN